MRHNDTDFAVDDAVIGDVRKVRRVVCCEMWSLPGKIAGLKYLREHSSKFLTKLDRRSHRNILASKVSQRALYTYFRSGSRISNPSMDFSYLYVVRFKPGNL